MCTYNVQFKDTCKSETKTILPCFKPLWNFLIQTQSFYSVFFKLIEWKPWNHILQFRKTGKMILTHVKQIIEQWIKYNAMKYMNLMWWDVVHRVKRINFIAKWWQNYVITMSLNKKLLWTLTLELIMKDRTLKLVQSGG
jgi:hypothetical protein